MSPIRLFNAALLLFVLAGPALAAGWDYDISTDKMTGKTSSTARVGSDNSLSFGFPYKGPNSGSLYVRQGPGKGLDVLVTIEKGQMICSASGCTVRVRFDEGQPMSFGASRPSDHSSTALFLDSEQRFVTQARKAKKILVEFTAYQQGNQVLEFSTAEPLKWPPK